MIGLGTIVNAVAVIVAGILGLGLSHGLSKSIQEGITRSLGLAVVFMGASTSIGLMLKLPDSSIMIVLSLSMGAALGEWIGIEQGLENLGTFLRTKFSSKSDSTFLEGFLTTSLTICIGAMAIVGAIEDAVFQNYSILYTKSILDFIFVFMMSSIYGVGAIFAVVPLVLLQGSVTLIAACMGAFMTSAMITNLSLIGNMLITCVGLNLLLNAKIKVANLLPALLIAVGFALIG